MSQADRLRRWAGSGEVLQRFPDVVRCSWPIREQLFYTPKSIQFWFYKFLLTLNCFHMYIFLNINLDVMRMITVNDFFFVSVMIDGFDYGCCQRWGDVILSCQKQNFKELGVVETRNDRYAINQNWKKLLVDGNRMKTYLHMSKYYYSLSDR
jgi:hypothetical protein